MALQMYDLTWNKTDSARSEVLILDMKTTLGGEWSILNNRDEMKKKKCAFLIFMIISWILYQGQVSRCTQHIFSVNISTADCTG